MMSRASGPDLCWPSGIAMAPVLLLLLGNILQTRGQAATEESVHYYTIEEELPPGTFIANIFADARVAQKYDSATLKQLQFRFLAKPEVALDIERDTGILRAGGRIDRDSKCPHQDSCEFKLDVVAHIPDPLRFLEIIKLHIEMTDLNDNAPEFPEKYMAQEVLESTQVGSSFVIPTASDPDSGVFGIQSYELVSTSSKFALDIKDKLDGSRELQLLLTEELDREQEDTYNMKVIAYDGGNPPRSGSVDVTIRVLDANDNDPVFDNTTYVVEIDENLTSGIKILRVHARDMDEGPYGDVVYGFSPSTRSAHGHLFGIVNTTGDLYIKGSIDYEVTPIYHLTVTARDKGPDSLAVDATVVIKVRDVNDNAPQITVNTLTETGTDLAEISEDAELETFVAYITVTDPDSGVNGKFNCSLNDNQFKLQLSQNTGEYQIVTQALLDRELRSEYNLALMCSDHGPIPQVSIKHIRVAVLDVNDNSPVFRQPSYSAQLVENNQVGAYIVQVNATDKDIGKNGEIRYKIVEKLASSGDDMRDLFIIDPVTGVIAAKSVLNYEQIKEVPMEIQAVDQGTPPRTASALVLVYLQDVNDEPPKFTQESYSFGVYENEPEGTEVGIMHAKDADGEPNNVVRFDLLPAEDSYDKFAIDPTVGRITTTAALDREQQSVYYLVVRATDQGDPPLSSTATVSVYVADRNDNMPVIHYPNPYNNTQHISNKSPIGYSFARVNASDRDMGKNANLSYWISGGNGHRYFVIDHQTGALMVNNDLQHIDYELVELEISVSDQGDPIRSIQANLNIIVNKSIIFPVKQPPTLIGNNFTIVVSVACVTAVVAILLIVAIVLLLKRNHGEPKHDKYVDTSKVMSVPLENLAPEVTSDKVDKGKINHYIRRGDAETTVTVDMDKGYISKTSSSSEVKSQPSPYAEDHDPPGYKDEASSPSITPAHALALKNGMTSQSQSHHAYHLPHNDIQVHKASQLLKPDPDTDSQSSADGSNADSGRGASEEGELIGKQSTDSTTSSSTTSSQPNSAGMNHLRGSTMAANRQLPIQEEHELIRPNRPISNRTVTFAKPMDPRDHRMDPRDMRNDPRGVVDPRASFKADLEKRLFSGPPPGHPGASPGRTLSRESLNQDMYNPRNMAIRETAILDSEPVRDIPRHPPYPHTDNYHSRTSPSAYRNYLTKKSPDFRTFSPPANKGYSNSNPGREYLHMTSPRPSNYRPPPGSEGNQCILKLEGSREISKDVMV